MALSLKITATSGTVKIIQPENLSWLPDNLNLLKHISLFFSISKAITYLVIL